MTIEERLETVERELAQAKRGNRRLVLTGAGLLLGLFALLVVGRSMTGVAQGQEKAAGKKVVWANEFVLVDDQGRARGALHVLMDGPALSLSDEKGIARVILAAPKTGPTLNLSDEKGMFRAGLSITELGPGLSLYDEKGKDRASLVVHNYYGPGLVLSDKNRKVIWQAP